MMVIWLYYTDDDDDDEEEEEAHKHEDKQMGKSWKAFRYRKSKGNQERKAEKKEEKGSVVYRWGGCLKLIVGAKVNYVRAERASKRKRVINTERVKNQVMRKWLIDLSFADAEPRRGLFDWLLNALERKLRVIGPAAPRHRRWHRRSKRDSQRGDSHRRNRKSNGKRRGGWADSTSLLRDCSQRLRLMMLKRMKRMKRMKRGWWGWWGWGW